MSKKQDNSAPDWGSFAGYASPNYTMVPDQLFDEHLAYLSGAELKVLLYIIRRTFGFKKEADTISLSQMLRGIRMRDGRYLDHGVGLSKPTLLQALRSLAEKNLIESHRQRSEERGDEPSVYSLCVAREEARGKEIEPPVVKKFDQGGGKEISPGPWSKNLTTQETELQETVKQDRANSNIRKAHAQKKVRQNDEQGPSPPVAGPLGTRPSASKGERGNASRRPQGSPPGFSSIGGVLAGRVENQTPASPTRTQKRYDEDHQRILAYIEDFAREFNDEAPLASSVSRAYNLYQRSGMPIEAFTTFLYEARALTQENSAKVKKVSETHTSSWGPEKNKMAYYFAILKDLVEQYAPNKVKAHSQSALQALEDGGPQVADTAAADPEPTPATNTTTPSTAGKGRGRRPRTTLLDAPESPPRPVSVERRPIRRHVPPSPVIGAFIADLMREWGNGENPPSQVEQTMELYAQSGLSEQGFLQTLSVVRTITDGHQATAQQDRLTLFFAILRQQLGLSGDGSVSPPAPG